MPLRNRSGFTLVELLVAIVLIDTGLLALAGATGALLRRQTELRARTVASALASNRLQSLGAIPCGRRSGTVTIATFTESWSEDDNANGARELRDSVIYNSYGVPHTLT